MLSDDDIAQLKYLISGLAAKEDLGTINTRIASIEAAMAPKALVEAMKTAILASVASKDDIAYLQAHVDQQIAIVSTGPPRLGRSPW